MQDLREVFSDDSEESVLQNLASLDYIPECSEDLSEIEDKNIVFYISGYIAKSQSSGEKCLNCRKMLSSGCDVDIVFENDENSDPNKGNKKENQLKEKFIQQVDRGGLEKPSDLLFTLCLYVWNFYNKINSDEDLRDRFFSFKNTRKTFSAAFMKSCSQDPVANVILHQKCTGGHSFAQKCDIIVKQLFNFFAKNFCNDMNSRCHERKKTGPSNAKKILKLCSH
jgi:hypothetical protein